MSQRKIARDAKALLALAAVCTIATAGTAWAGAGERHQ